MLILPDK